MNRSLPKVELRRIDEGTDEHVLFLWRNDPRVYSWCRQNDVLHRERHVEWAKNQAFDASVSMYAIESVDDEQNTEMVGVCGLTSIDYINSRAEFSLYINPNRQGEGFGESALRALLDKAFNAYNLNLVWGESFAGNPAVKMFERIGFTHEGTRRNFYYRDGEYLDANLYSIQRSDYARSGLHLKRDQPDTEPCGFEDGSAAPTE